MVVVETDVTREKILPTSDWLQQQKSSFFLIKQNRIIRWQYLHSHIHAVSGERKMLQEDT